MPTGLSQVEALYLETLLAHPTVATVPGSAGGEPLSVEQIYVPRTVLHEVVPKDQTRDDDRPRSGTRARDEPPRDFFVKLPVDLWEKVRDQRVVLLEGPAGMGKSTLTKHLVRESYAQQRWLPIWIPFRTFAAARLPLREYLETIYAPWLGLSDVRVERPSHRGGQDLSLGQWLYDQWWSGFGLLILDGLDEVFAHDERVTLLRGLPAIGTAQTRPATILTSRPLSQSLPLQRATVELQGLTPQDQALLLDRYRQGLHLTESQVHTFRQELQQPTQRRVHELLTRPGHLIQILTAYAQTGVLPTTETEVVEQLIQGRLTITGRIQPPVEPDEPGKKRHVLASLALHLVACRQGQRHTRAQLLALIRQVLHEWATHDSLLFPLSQATALLNDLTRNSGLLSEVEPEVYEFETVIWAHALAGWALADDHVTKTLGLTQAQVREFLDKKAWDPEWEPVLRSWVGNTETPLPFLRGLTEAATDDCFRHRLGLAGRCLFHVRQEVQRGTVYQDLSAGIASEAYALWRLLAVHSWHIFVARSLRGWNRLDESQVKLASCLGEWDVVLFDAAVPTLQAVGPSLTIQTILNLTERFKEPRKWWSYRWSGDWLFSPSGEANEGAAVAQSELWVAAATVLQGVGEWMPHETVIALTRCLNDRHPGVQEAIAKALVSVGRKLPKEVNEAVAEVLLRPARLEVQGNDDGVISETVQKYTEDLRQVASRTLEVAGPLLFLHEWKAEDIERREKLRQELKGSIDTLMVIAQQLGFRLFVAESSHVVQAVADLSATEAFPDWCQQASGYRAASFDADSSAHPFVPLLTPRVPRT